MSARKDRRGFGRLSRANGRGEGRGNEPDKPAGPDAPLNDLTGNGIVNNGPDNELSGLGHTGAAWQRWKWQCQWPERYRSRCQ